MKTRKRKGFQFLESLIRYGAHGRSRTSDRLVRSQVLYPAELHAHRGRYYATSLKDVNQLLERFLTIFKLV